MVDCSDEKKVVHLVLNLVAQSGEMTADLLVELKEYLLGAMKVALSDDLKVGSMAENSVDQ